MTVNVDTQSLIASMRDVVGQAYLLTDKAKSSLTLKGFVLARAKRLGSTPRTLVEICDA